VIKVRFWKSKEEKEFERKQRVRQTKRKIGRYINNCETLRDEYEKNAIEARRLENDSLTRRFAAKMLILGNQIKKMRAIDLVLRDIELSRGQASVFNSMAVTMKDFAKVMDQEQVSARTAAEMSNNLDRILIASEKIDDMLEGVVDSMSDKILDVSDVSDRELENVLKDIEVKAGVEEEASFRVRESSTSSQRVNQVTSTPKRENVDQSRDPLDKRIEDGLDKIKKNRRK